MPAISIGELRQTISDCLEQVKEHRLRVVVTKHNNPVAAIVSLEDLLLLERIHKMTDYIIARAMWEEVKDQGTVPWEEAKARLDAIMEAKRRQEQQTGVEEVEQTPDFTSVYPIDDAFTASYVREPGFAPTTGARKNSRQVSSKKPHPSGGA